MRKYEIMFIVRPDIEAEVMKKTVDDMKTLLENHKAKVEVEDMGQKELAYEVKKYQNGHYYLFAVELEDLNGISEFDRLALISNNIIRHLIVRVDK